MRRLLIGALCLGLVAGCTDQGQKSADPAPENRVEGMKPGGNTRKVDPKGRERPTADDDGSRTD
jgi:hypothetical protein